MEMMHQTDDTLVQKWEPVLEGIDSDYTRRVTAQLLENQAKSIVEERLTEDITAAATTTGQLGTFQKFAFPLVRRVYPKLLANSLVGVQPMQGPVSQVFYLGNDRAKNGGVGAGNIQTVYSKFNLTYRGLTASAIGSLSADNPPGVAVAATNAGGTFLTDAGKGGGIGLDGDIAANSFDVSNVLAGSGLEVVGAGAGSGTMGGRIAAWPNPDMVMGYTMSAGERLTGTGIPEMTFHIEQEAVVANTRKMRALWTLEASQDLKAYHNLDLERELTDMLGKELRLEIDRELIEDLRMLSYDVDGELEAKGSKWKKANLDQANSNNFVLNPDMATNDAAADFLYDYTTGTDTAGTNENVFLYDFSTSSLDFAPQHVGHVYANLLAMLQLMAQDIYKTTMRGPGNWIVCSPLIASMLHSAAKLEGGMERSDGPTNVGGANIEYKGKLAGQWDLYVDPMYPEDELMMGYKGANAMDSGYVYSPYIPLQTLPTIVDPTDFQPRKGILTRYGKAAVTPASRYYRILRLIGPTANFLFTPFAKVKGGMA